MTDAIYLAIPFPPSANRGLAVGRSEVTGKPIVYQSPEKRGFVKRALELYMTQKRGLLGKRIAGPFTYHITLNEKLRHGNADGDNRQKYAIDFLQKVNLIDNDKLAEGGSWSWAPCEHEALISIWPASSNRVPDSTTGARES